MEFKKETVTYVDAVLYNGDNEAEVMELFRGEVAHSPEFAKMEATIQGEKVSILVVRYKNKKEEEKKLTVSNGKYLVLTSRSVNVQDKEKFENAYEAV